jgi:hypothetical protein
MHGGHHGRVVQRLLSSRKRADGLVPGPDSLHPREGQSGIKRRDGFWRDKCKDERGHRKSGGHQQASNTC